MGSSPVVNSETLTVDILYIEQKIERPPVLSNLVSWPDDEGLQGAQLGVADNNTTGKFMEQEFALTTLIYEVGDDVAERNESIRQALASGSKLVLLNLSSTEISEISALPEAADDLLLNARSPDAVLRNEACAPNLLHTVPSRAMHGDALAQFFVQKKWRDVFLIQGNRPGDQALATAIKRSLDKFGLDIVEDKSWIEDADIRRNASREIPVFTQAKRYDVVVVTDEDQDFSQYVPFNTWLPRPVVGSAGLTPVTWSPVIEQWGAAQLQSRFTKQANRPMNGVDYSNWAAVRAIGEAVTRTSSIDPALLRVYMLSEAFELAGFKGAPLSFRTWNGQMRQPIQLTTARAVVATAPIEGFLHPNTELDTLGFDKGESSCTAFN